ncbi:MAG: ABC transporter ATP-binding protein [Ruminococcaceae bacterium]|nr:ABC transporter ATP-binding protein [Oscillospiraceae bacterium]
MIVIENISKSYGDVKSLTGISAEINSGSIYGLIGSNGSGKSTLLRIMSGIMRSDGGTVMYDGANVYENSDVKESVVYLSDEQFFLPNSTVDEMAYLYSSLYKSFSKVRYYELINLFGLDGSRRISTFSKGMKKQAAILLGLSCCPKYLLCDETFDGLDPVMRQFVKKILAQEVADRGLTPVIASHNLREIEDICDHIGLLHKGGILFESEIDSLKQEIHTVQAIFDNGKSVSDIFADFHVVSSNKRGNLLTTVVRGDREAIENAMRAAEPKYFELIPLTLEEIFISEMEERGYDYSNVIF